jgi:hypothetical protein
MPLVEYSWAKIPSHDYHAPESFVALTGMTITATNSGGASAP